ncbi:MAG: hypothetical protein OHK0039_02530 [Bacteroidia bacterium]
MGLGQAQRNPVFAILLGWLIYLIGLGLLFPAFVWVLASGSGIPWSAVQELLSGRFEAVPAGDLLFRVMQGAHQLLSWGLAGWVLWQIVRASESQQPAQWLPLSLAVLLVVAATPVASWLYIEVGDGWPPLWRSWLDPLQDQDSQSRDMLGRLLAPRRISTFVMNIVVFAALPALCEELFFRGFLQKQLMRLVAPQIAVWVTAVLFSLAHLQLLGFFSRALLGVLLGYAYLRTRTLWSSIAAHFAFNALSIVIIQQWGGSIARFPLWGVALSAAAVICLLIVLFRFTKPSYPASEPNI